MSREMTIRDPDKWRTIQGWQRLGRRVIKGQPGERVDGEVLFHAIQTRSGLPSRGPGDDDLDDDKQADDVSDDWLGGDG